MIITTVTKLLLKTCHSHREGTSIGCGTTFTYFKINFNDLFFQFYSFFILFCFYDFYFLLFVTFADSSISSSSEETENRNITFPFLVVCRRDQVV